MFSKYYVDSKVEITQSQLLHPAHNWDFLFPAITEARGLIMFSKDQCRK